MTGTPSLAFPTKKTAGRKTATKKTSSTTKKATTKKTATRKVAASKKKPAKKAARKKAAPKKKQAAKKKPAVKKLFKLPKDQRPPKRPATALALYMQEYFAAQSTKGLPLKVTRDRMTAGAQEWNNLSATEKQRYYDRVSALREQYKTDYLLWFRNTDPKVVRAYNKTLRLKGKRPIRRPEGGRRPPTPYIRFFVGMRDPSASLVENAKSASAAWKALPEAEKKKLSDEFRTELAKWKRENGQ